MHTPSQAHRPKPREVKRVPGGHPASEEKPGRVPALGHPCLVHGCVPGTRLTGPGTERRYTQYMLNAGTDSEFPYKDKSIN